MNERLSALLHEYGAVSAEISRLNAFEARREKQLALLSIQRKLEHYRDYYSVLESCRNNPEFVKGFRRPRCSEVILEDGAE